MDIQNENSFAQALVENGHEAASPMSDASGSAAGEQLFFSLLRCAAQGRDADVGQAPPSGARVWARVYRLAREQALAGVLFDVVQRLPREWMPPKALLMEWYALAAQVRQRNRRMNAATMAVQAELRRRGLRSTLLKGQGLALLYAQPLSRMSGDIDVWVEGSRRHVLLALPPRGGAKVVYHHTKLYLKDGTEVEVHFTPSWMNRPVMNRRLQRWFSAVADEQFRHEVELPEEAGRASVTTAAFNRVYVLVHIYRHLFGEGVGLRQLMDYYHVLRQDCAPEERAETMRTLRRLRMGRFAGAVMYVMQHVFGLEDRYLLTAPDEREGRFLLSEVMQAGNFGMYDARIVRRPNERAWQRFSRRVRRNLRFWRSYPGEVFFTPVFKVWHTVWRRWHGY